MTQEYDEGREHVVELFAKGIGYGDGAISTGSRFEDGTLTPELLQSTLEIIEQSEDVFPRVDPDANDDGCGDGRPTGRVFRWLKRNGQKYLETFQKSRRRAKVFGGGLVVVASMLRVIKGQPDERDSVLQDRNEAAGYLHGLGVEYGAHTDNHAHGDNCGCGAIDNYPKITAHVTQFAPQLRRTMQALYGEEEFAANKQSIDDVFAYYRQLTAHEATYFRDAAGKRTMALLEDQGTVIKQLEDAHLEAVIVLNDVDGTTFDQRELDRLIQERHGEEATIQAFVVDTWRGRMYAEAMAKIAAMTFPEQDAESVRQRAYADFMIRSTLAVAATLTAGDLPVITRRYADKPSFALTD